jgi:hypothetical protein
MLMSREQILQQRLKIEKIEVPWIPGGEINLRALPGHVTQIAAEMEPSASPNAFVFVNAVVDQNGQRLYSDEDAKLVADTVDNALVQLVVAAAFRISTIPKDRREIIKQRWDTDDTTDPAAQQQS